jgi:hypothetical protein
MYDYFKFACLSVLFIISVLLSNIIICIIIHRESHMGYTAAMLYSLCTTMFPIMGALYALHVVITYILYVNHSIYQSIHLFVYISAHYHFLKLLYIGWSRSGLNRHNAPGIIIY